jgi:pimeloyl-ACP methyl ester carboxylesterase
MKIFNMLAVTVTIPLAMPTGFAAGTSCSWSKNQYGRHLQPTATLVEYFTASDADPNDPRCSGQHCSLWGWLYKPDPYYACPPDSHTGGISDASPCFVPSKHPAIVFNHGHNLEREEVCAIADFFTRNGFVLFAPLRRGTRDTTTGKQNTGQYIDQCMVPGSGPGEVDELPKNLLMEPVCLADQVKEVDAALKYLAGTAAADKSRIALLGHSFGGSLTVYAAAATLSVHPRAAVDISGGTLDWNDNVWYTVLAPPGLPFAVMARKMPIFFLQPSNEANLEPTIRLSSTAGQFGDRMMQAAFYPPVLPDHAECPSKITDLCDGPGVLINKKVHSRFVNRSEHVQTWGPTVLEFLKRYDVQ